MLRRFSANYEPGLQAGESLAGITGVVAVSVNLTALAERTARVWRSEEKKAKQATFLPAVLRKKSKITTQLRCHNVTSAQDPPRTDFCGPQALVACALASGQTLPTFDLSGSLELVDLPPEATPVEEMMVSLHPLVLDYEIQAWPDRNGKFVLKNVKPGRYSLTLPFPGRIRTFAIGSKELAQDGFELNSSDVGSLRIVVSEKTNQSICESAGATQRTGAIAL